MNFEKEYKKHYGLLIYACGNNDLEPEISDSVFSINKNLRQDIVIAVQLGRAPLELVKKLRPCHQKKTHALQAWRGVKRYIVDSKDGWCDESTTCLSENDTVSNMADPNTLLNFLNWAFSAIDADEYTIVLSGHGAGFIGAMADLTCAVPQIMGIPQIAAALRKSIELNNKKPRLLIMDACYMKTVENLYEFASAQIADVFYGPSELISLEGYGYNKIIKNIGTNPNKLNTAINERSVLLDKRKFVLLKTLLSGIASRLLQLGIKPGQINKTEDLSINLATILNSINKLTKDTFLRQQIVQTLNLLLQLGHHQDDPNRDSLHIFCPAQTEDFEHLADYYSPLSFSENNVWPLWLAGVKNICTQHLNKTGKEFFTSNVLPLGLLTQHLSSLSPQKNANDFKKLYQSLGWLNEVTKNESGNLP